MSPRETEPIERTGAVAKHLVRVTQEPVVVHEVDDTELLDLARQGILHSFERTDAAASVLDEVSDLPRTKWKAPERGADIVTPPPAVTESPSGEKGA